MAKRAGQNREEVVGFVGVGLDNNDGHTRVTQTDYFYIVGGSEETHGGMQDTAIYFNETLENKGKALHETSHQEALDILREAMERS